MIISLTVISTERVPTEYREEFLMSIGWGLYTTNYQLTFNKQKEIRYAV